MHRQLFLIASFFLTFITEVSGQIHPLKTYRTVLVNDSTFMTFTEVTVNDWIEFIINNKFDSTLFPVSSGLSQTISLVFDDLKNKQEQKYFTIKEQSLDTYNYSRILTTTPNSKLKELFKSDTAYPSINIPITGITFEQAVSFCQWKEGILNERRTIKIKLGLPSIELYKSVIPNKDSLNDKKCALFNWAFCNCATPIKKNIQTKFQGKSLVRADSYWPSELGLYNLQGNASEMTSTRGIAIGGSFRHFARDSYNDKDQKYEKPEDWLGFRYIVTYK